MSNIIKMVVVAIIVHIGIGYIENNFNINDISSAMGMEVIHTMVSHNEGTQTQVNHL